MPFGARADSIKAVNREFLVDVRNGEAHVLLSGEIDVEALPAVRRAVERAINSAAAGVVMNLDAVTFLDSTGLSGIVVAYRRASAVGKGYRITSAERAEVARVLEISKLGGLTAERHGSGRAGETGGTAASGA